MKITITHEQGTEDTEIVSHDELWAAYRNAFDKVFADAPILRKGKGDSLEVTIRITTQKES